MTYTERLCNDIKEQLADGKKCVVNVYSRKDEELIQVLIVTGLERKTLIGTDRDTKKEVRVTMSDKLLFVAQSSIKRYQIPFAYERYGYLTVYADSKNAACKKAEAQLNAMKETEMAALSDYLEDSATIDWDGCGIDEAGNHIDLS